MEVQKFLATVTNNTSYCGETLESYIIKCFTKSKFVESIPAQNIISDIKFKTKFGKLSGSGLVQCGSSCEFHDGGELVASDEVLEPKPFFINKQICYEDLEPIFNSLNSGAMSKEELSAAFATAITDLLVSKMNYATQDAFLNGVSGASSACTDQFSGVLEQIQTNVFTGTTGLTSANIIAQLANLVNEVPECVLEEDDLTIYMNRKTLQLYYNALAALASLTPLDTLKPNYMGIPIVTVPTIPANVMFVTQTSNIYVGVGALDEFSSLDIINMRPLGQGNNVRLVLQGKADVKLGWEDQAAKWTL
jgi:hypothetical protein